MERGAGGTNLVEKKGGGEYDSERRAFVSLPLWRAATPEPVPAVERSNLLRALLLCRAAEGLVEPTRHREKQETHPNTETLEKEPVDKFYQPSTASETRTQRTRRTKRTLRETRESERGKVKEKKEGKGGRKDAGTRGGAPD